MAIELRMAMPPRYNFAQHTQAKMSEMMRCRQVYKRQEYPLSLVLRIFVELNVLNIGWEELLKCFTTDNHISDLDKAGEQIDSILNPLWTKAQDMSRHIFLSMPTLGGISFKDLIEMACKGKEGDNSQVEAVEYSYVCYSAIYQIMRIWWAFGLAGKSPDVAYIELVGYCAYDKEKNLDLKQLLTDFSNATVCFSDAINIYVGGGPFIKGTYHPLSPLW